jgi:hypothetical protein
MRKSASLVAALGGMLVLLSHGAPGQAAPRTWVSATGSDLTICSRAAPCQSYAAAYAQTDTGGEINCLDAGDFGTLVIAKSISIVCDHTEGGVFAPSAAHGFHIDAPAGSVITLKGQDIKCTGSGTHGILLNNTGITLHIHKVQIRNCASGSVSGIAVLNNSGVATVLVADSHVSDNGGGINGAGIVVNPIGGASANVSVVRTHLENNMNGVFADGSGGAGPSNVTVQESVISGSPNVGIAVSSTGAAFTASVDNTLINFSANAGAAVAGSAATLRIGGSVITQNVTGVANFGGTLQSFKDNVIAGNLTDGTPVAVVPAPGGPLQ